MARSDFTHSVSGPIVCRPLGTGDTRARAFARRLAALPSAKASDLVPLPVLAQALAGALFALLQWWIDHDAPYSPERMDEMYHAIYQPAA